MRLFRNKHHIDRLYNNLDEIPENPEGGKLWKFQKIREDPLDF